MLSILTSGESAQTIIIEIFAMLFAMIIAFTVHEWAHGFVAYKNGDLTAKFAGRLTLNPIKHIDPFGFLMLLLAGFGWAKPVPIDSNNFKSYKKGIITVSLAGVIANLILATISAGLLAIVFAIVKAAPAPTNIFSELMILLFIRFFLYLIVINLTLMAFNILPIYPLDGFHVLETFTKANNPYCTFMRRYGNIFLIALIVGSSLLGRISPYLNVFGLYLQSISNGIMKIFSFIFKI